MRKEAEPKMHSLIEKKFKDFILKQKHPCVMAKSVFVTNNYHIREYADMGSGQTVKALLTDIAQFLSQYDFTSNQFESFIAVFPNNNFDNEIDFENSLWDTLQKLYDLDNVEWDSTVSDDPHNPNFSFSINGKAFYIVGLHPNSSRLARRSPYTAIVFNLHWQFERLRQMGSYKKIKKRIRKRDKKLQGFINPVLKDFGKDTETKQYSGRQVGDNWKCPFHSNNS